MVLKTYKYRLYPTKAQCGILGSQLELHRQLYNAALEQRVFAYKQRGKSVSCYGQINELPNLKAECPEYQTCNQSSLGQTLRRLDKSFQGFFRRVKSGQKAGFPRFRKFGAFDTIEFSGMRNGGQIRDNRLYIQHAGLIKVKWHRELPVKPKTLSITRRNDKWYVNFIVDMPAEALPPAGHDVGIDVGLTAFIATSDGETIEAPKHFVRAHHRIKRAQQRVARRKKGGNRRRKAAVLLAKHHEHIQNQRRDFHHKTARKLVNENDMIAAEKLNIAGLVRNNHLSKAISDAGWGAFLNILRDKAESAGRAYVEVNPSGTSQRCSGCDAVVQKSLSVRVHSCPSCGLVIDRDVNAARNILKLARTGPSALAVLSTASPRSCCALAGSVVTDSQRCWRGKRDGPAGNILSEGEISWT